MTRLENLIETVKTAKLFSAEEVADIAIKAVFAERERCTRIVENGLGKTNTAIAREIREGGAE